MAKVDHYQVVTDRIIEALESGVAPWQRDWEGAAGSSMMPRRATGEFYRGINVLLLWIASMGAGYKADQWMTFKQAKAAGGMVRKGEKGTGIVFFNMLEKTDKVSGEKTKIPMLRGYSVFNVEQIDGLPEKFAPVDVEAIDTGARADASLDQFFAATGAKIVHTGGQPLYRPMTDTIEMPNVSQFKTADSYYGTLAHELIHWTGHATRLDRLGGQSKPEYAFEELIAEMGSLFLTGTIGATPNFDRSAAYLDSWLQALRGDKKYIFKAATAAQKATDLALELGGRMQEAKAA